MNSSKTEEERVVSKRLWSKEEDELLLSIVSISDNPKWATISQEFNEKVKKIPNKSSTERTNKQCRQRWQNHLNPALKNYLPWTPQQHKALFILFKQYSHQWCELALRLQQKGFQKRSDNNIKNYFYSALKRQVKKMNELIRQNNKEIKKKKSVLHQYSAKYLYKQRLSLQRQILEGTNEFYNSQSNANCPFEHKRSSQPLPESSELQLDEEEKINLHIVKELDQDLISKILLIAEEKANKKYIISNNHTQEYQEQALKLRDQLIQIITNNQQPLNKEQVLKLAKNMLNISRKCKKKTNSKPQSSIRIDLRMEEEKKTKSIPISSPKAEEILQSNNFQFTIPAEIKKQGEKSPNFNKEIKDKDAVYRYMLEENQKPNLTNKQDTGIQKYNNQFSTGNDDPFNPFNVNFYPSVDFSRAYLDRSSEFYNSGCFQPPPFGLISCLDPNPAGFKLPFQADAHQINQNSIKSFLDEIKVVNPGQQTLFQDFNPNSNIIPLFKHQNHELKQDIQDKPPSNNQLISSWPIFGSNSQEGKKNSKSGSHSGSEHLSQILSRSWVYAENKIDQHISLSNSANLGGTNEPGGDQWGFRLPKSNFHKFQGQ